MTKYLARRPTVPRIVGVDMEAVELRALAYYLGGSMSDNRFPHISTGRVVTNRITIVRISPRQMTRAMRKNNPVYGWKRTGLMCKY